MDKILILLDLQKSAREALSIEAFGFTVVNATQKLVPYDQALFWLYNNGATHLKSASGNVVIDRHGEYIKALENQITKLLLDQNAGIKKISNNDLSDFLNSNFSGQALNILFQTENDGILGGMWLERKQSFHDSEIHVLEELSQSYSFSLALLKLRKKRLVDFSFAGKKINRKVMMAAILIFLFFPFQLSVTAPAEIVAKDPAVITIPYDGVLDKVHVRPGDEVISGQVLASMDKTTLGAKIDIALQNLESAKASLARISREALATPEKKTELNLLQSQIHEKKIYYDHAQKMMERSDILTPKSGVAIFSDPSAIEGKPLNTGEKIMLIADPIESELLIRIPADALIPFNSESKVKFHLNITPLGTKRATITSIGYQASPDPDGLLTYKVRARFSDEQNLRIGWKGSASIKGDWTILSYALLRRPLIALRNLLGI